nr:hypothetical protein [Halomonas olivaria]
MKIAAGRTDQAIGIVQISGTDVDTLRPPLSLGIVDIPFHRQRQGVAGDKFALAVVQRCRG